MKNNQKTYGSLRKTKTYGLVGVLGVMAAVTNLASVDVSADEVSVRPIAIALGAQSQTVSTADKSALDEAINLAKTKTELVSEIKQEEPIKHGVISGDAAVKAKVAEIEADYVKQADDIKKRIAAAETAHQAIKTAEATNAALLTSYQEAKEVADRLGKQIADAKAKYGDGVLVEVKDIVSTDGKTPESYRNYTEAVEDIFKANEELLTAYQGKFNAEAAQSQNTAAIEAQNKAVVRAIVNLLNDEDNGRVRGIFFRDVLRAVSVLYSEGDFSSSTIAGDLKKDAGIYKSNISLDLTTAGKYISVPDRGNISLSELDANRANVVSQPDKIVLEGIRFEGRAVTPIVLSVGEQITATYSTKDLTGFKLEKDGVPEISKIKVVGRLTSSARKSGKSTVLVNNDLPLGTFSLLDNAFGAMTNQDDEFIDGGKTSMDVEYTFYDKDGQIILMDSRGLSEYVNKLLKKAGASDSILTKPEDFKEFDSSYYYSELLSSDESSIEELSTAVPDIKDNNNVSRSLERKESILGGRFVATLKTQYNTDNMLVHDVGSHSFLMAMYVSGGRIDFSDIKPMPTVTDVPKVTLANVAGLKQPEVIPVPKFDKILVTYRHHEFSSKEKTTIWKSTDNKVLRELENGLKPDKEGDDIPGWRFVETRTTKEGNLENIYEQKTTIWKSTDNKVLRELEKGLNPDKEGDDIPGWRFVETRTTEEGNLENIYEPIESKTVESVKTLPKTTAVSGTAIRVFNDNADKQLVLFAAGLSLLGLAGMAYKGKHDKK